MPVSSEQALALPSEGAELRSDPYEAGNTYESVTRGRDIESLAGTDSGADGNQISEKRTQENDCTLVRSFTPGNRQLDVEPPPDGGMQAWLQGDTPPLSMPRQTSGWDYQLTNKQF